MPLDPGSVPFRHARRLRARTRAAAGAPPPAIIAHASAARKARQGPACRADYIWSAGEPGRAILDAAQTSGARLIVLGEHHHGFLGSFLGGDVGAEVRKHADCDVILAQA